MYRKTLKWLFGQELSVKAGAAKRPFQTSRVTSVPPKTPFGRIMCHKCKGRPWTGHPLIFELRNRLQRLHFLGLPALGSFDDLKLHVLSFFQAAEALGLNRGEMHEYVLTRLAADETIPFGVIEPLNCSLFHVGTVPLFQILR